MAAERGDEDSGRQWRKGTENVAGVKLPRLRAAMQEHWFTVRKVNGEWWNFNSLLPAPLPLTSLYLTLFLSTLGQQGYTIFVVRLRARRVAEGCMLRQAVHAA